MTPRRVQLRRARGWRKPADAVVVARPTKWHNPYRVSEYGRAEALQLYRAYLDEHPDVVAEARRALAGRDLACWCPLDVPCHADILLSAVNGSP